MNSVDSRASINIEPMVLPLEEWTLLGAGTELQINGVPGSWCRKPKRLVAPQMMAMVCCPNCKNISVLHKKVHEIDRFGKVTPDFICKYTGCSFHRKLYLDKWNDKPLYICTIVRAEKAEYEHIFCHARSQAEARLHIGPGVYTIVAIGLAVNAKAIA